MNLNIKQYDLSNPPKLNWKSGDMQAFTQEVEDNVNCVITDVNVDKMEKQLRTIILKAAHSKIGLFPVVNWKQEWLTEEVKDLIEERDKVWASNNLETIPN